MLSLFKRKKAECFKDDIEELRRDNMQIMLFGDFNGHIGPKINGKFKGKDQNGRFVQRLAEEDNLEVLNLDPRCHGKWIANGLKQQTVVDYVSVDNYLSTKTNDIVIDDQHMI